MIAIDGSHGEGGGQIVRTSLALSLVTGKPFQIANIRAGREKPGLMRQHLTAVKAAAEIGQARVIGSDIGSTAFSFHPTGIKAGNYQFAVGTAGSCTLVLQAIMPALIMAEGPSVVVLEGGTHNPYSPSFDFLESVFLPHLKRMGPNVKVTLERPGFYPAGGGRFSVAIEPQNVFNGIEILHRGNLIRKKAIASVSQLPATIGERELNVIKEKLGWSDDVLEILTVTNSQGPGNVLSVKLDFEQMTELMIAFGERGVSAENVAGKAVKQINEYMKYDAPVGRFLADQLLIPMALAGKGRFRTLPLSGHTKTNMDIIRRFLDLTFVVTVLDNGVREVRILS